ncbi:gamma-glutamylcyclotransferase family protein [Flavisolibacter ginsenosidimutans]|uniref:gamma-glutamylcyclotransferase family protein n=1 Tax=Flavisolibacter ginsenosidimutans TaxID=661481 RepID=UPI00155B18F6|nr:gamma-glutamylcyclotransferase family protein [Flavisolibacter ginsenosidimutans]
MNQCLFSYGTLQKTQTQIALFGRILQGWPDVLNGYKTTTVEIKDEAFLAKGEQTMQQTAVATNNENDSIEGTAFELTEEELLNADKYEPEGYERIKIKLASGKEAWLYVAIKET